MKASEIIENALKDIDGNEIIGAVNVLIWEYDLISSDHEFFDQNRLFDMMSECEWKPEDILARTYHGYRLCGYKDNGEEIRESFCLYDDYFVFNGYGNLVSMYDITAAEMAKDHINDCIYNNADDLYELEKIASALYVDISEADEYKVDDDD